MPSNRRWANEVNADRALKFEAILGYHPEQAHRYLRELGPVDEVEVAIGADAAARLASARRCAFARGDMHVAANLLRRATVLLAEDNTVRIALLPELGEALMELGDFRRTDGHRFKLLASKKFKESSEISRTAPECVFTPRIGG